MATGVFTHGPTSAVPLPLRLPFVTAVAPRVFVCHLLSPASWLADATSPTLDCFSLLFLQSTSDRTTSTGQLAALRDALLPSCRGTTDAAATATCEAGSVGPNSFWCWFSSFVFHGSARRRCAAVFFPTAFCIHHAPANLFTLFAFSSPPR